MSQENVEIVRRSIEYFVRTDENLWETIDSEVEVHDHALPDAGVYRGHAGWLKWQDDFDSLWEDTGGLEPEEYIDAGGDKVIAVLRMWVQGRGGIPVEWRDASVHTLRNGKIVRLDVYGDLAEAFEAVGLPESDTSPATSKG